MLGNNHICPAFDGPKPHVGGPVLTGSESVFIEGKPACRKGDSLQCNSPNLDSVQAGSNCVFIDGKPAARMGDSTSHGGTIIEGSTSVFIG